jgi:hypothetical protein
MPFIVGENAAAVGMVENKVVDKTISLARHVVRHQSVRPIVMDNVVTNRVVARTDRRLANVDRELDARMRRAVTLIVFHDIVARS